MSGFVKIVIIIAALFVGAMLLALIIGFIQRKCWEHDQKVARESRREINIRRAAVAAGYCAYDHDGVDANKMLRDDTMRQVWIRQQILNDHELARFTMESAQRAANEAYNAANSSMPDQTIFMNCM